MRAALLLLFQAAALLADPRFLAPATVAAAAWFAGRKESRSRVLLGTGVFGMFFFVLCLLGAVEGFLRLSAPDYGCYALLTLRGYASFLVVVAGTAMFTLAEILCFLKRIRVPGYILTMVYLMVHDLSVFVRLASETGRAVRSRGAGLRLPQRLKLTIHAARNFMVFAVLKFRLRHEHIQARGLSLDLPLDEWRARERLPQSG